MARSVRAETVLIVSTDVRRGAGRHIRSVSTLITDPRISWPESFSFGPDGYLYFVASQLHLSSPLNEGKNKAIPPFYVFRIKPLAPGTVGR